MGCRDGAPAPGAIGAVGRARDHVGPMPLTLVTGPANSAKAGVVLDAFRARRRQEPWLVVPTRGDVLAFERELLGEGATKAGRITTFAGLTREVARRAGWWQRSVGALQRERLVDQAIADAPLDALAGVAGTPGFLHAALALDRRAGALAHHTAALHGCRARLAGGAARRARGRRDLRPLRARAGQARPRRPRAVRLACARRAARAAGRVGRDARPALRLRRPHAARARRRRDARSGRRRGRHRLADL